MEFHLPTHVSPRQFTLAPMHKFDHSDANSLSTIYTVHNTAMILFQIKPTSNIRKPLKAKSI